MVDTEKWDVRFLQLAQHLAQWSKDPSTKVGCVVVGPDREVCSTGYNGFPRGISDDPQRLLDREYKYQLMVHAEMNALLHASRHGVRLKDCTAYVTWPPCVRCAVSLIQAGILRVVWPRIDIPQRWAKDFALTRNVFDEGQVATTEYVL